MWENDIFDEFQRLQEELFRPRRMLIASPGKDIQPYFRSPVTELQETENALIASFDMPGVDKKDIQLNISEDGVEVKVEQKLEKETKNKEGRYYSMASRSFYRCMPLPKRINADKATAEYKDGVLRIEMPKLNKEKATKRLIVK